MTTRLLLISIGLATYVTALGYALGGLWIWSPLIIAGGGLWWLGQRRRWGWTASVGLVFFTGAAAGGLWLDLAAGWALFGVVAALAAWDLDHFMQRLRDVGQVERARQFERRHLQRLFIVDGLGLFLATVALGVKIRLGFGAAFLLGLLAVLGLGRLIGFLRYESN